MSTPTLPAGHEEFETLAVAWAFAALEPDEQARFEAHSAAGCDACAAQVTAALAVGLELAYAVPDEDPPPDLRGRLLAAAAVPGGEPAGTSPFAWADGPDPAGPPRPARPPDRDWIAVRERPREPARHAAPRRRPGRRLVAALAAAAVLGVSAVTTWQVAGDGPAAPASRVAALSAREGDRSVATVVLTDGRADVVTDGLPPNAGRDTQYVLWGVPSGDGGAPKALGSFVVGSADLHSYPVRLSAPTAGYPVLAVSEEPAGALPAAPSRVLARGAIDR